MAAGRILTPGHHHHQLPDRPLRRKIRKQLETNEFVYKQWLELCDVVSCNKFVTTSHSCHATIRLKLKSPAHKQMSRPGSETQLQRRWFIVILPCRYCRYCRYVDTQPRVCCTSHPHQSRTCGCLTLAGQEDAPRPGHVSPDYRVTSELCKNVRCRVAAPITLPVAPDPSPCWYRFTNSCGEILEEFLKIGSLQIPQHHHRLNGWAGVGRRH